jgi:hypothetical protein
VGSKVLTLAVKYISILLISAVVFIIINRVLIITVPRLESLSKTRDLRIYIIPNRFSRLGICDE